MGDDREGGGGTTASARVALLVLVVVVVAAVVFGETRAADVAARSAAVAAAALERNCAKETVGQPRGTGCPDAAEPATEPLDAAPDRKEATATGSSYRSWPHTKQVSRWLRLQGAVQPLHIQSPALIVPPKLRPPKSMVQSCPMRMPRGFLLPAGCHA